MVYNFLYIFLIFTKKNENFTPIFEYLLYVFDEN